MSEFFRNLPEKAAAMDISLPRSTVGKGRGSESGYTVEDKIRYISIHKDFT